MRGLAVVEGETPNVTSFRELDELMEYTCKEIAEGVRGAFRAGLQILSHVADHRGVGDDVITPHRQALICAAKQREDDLDEEVYKNRDIHIAALRAARAAGARPGFEYEADLPVSSQALSFRSAPLLG